MVDDQVHLLLLYRLRTLLQRLELRSLDLKLILTDLFVGALLVIGFYLGSLSFFLVRHFERVHTALDYHVFIVRRLHPRRRLFGLWGS